MSCLAWRLGNVVICENCCVDCGIHMICQFLLPTNKSTFSIFTQNLKYKRLLSISTINGGVSATAWEWIPDYPTIFIRVRTCIWIELLMSNSNRQYSCLRIHLNCLYYKHQGVFFLYWIVFGIPPIYQLWLYFLTAFSNIIFLVCQVYAFYMTGHDGWKMDGSRDSNNKTELSLFIA